ncbi:selenoneine biosynthesis selenosugar synthase SenB [Massilia endophytica]|uniref:selenoneine biosynthesis selenosugar synthase SenB n=1 Tax=Massilia endophytica TaxID=2899220 RepID=UPI001E446A54|nr:selenoneine biosynthesis selenosugar synthase SenB [Massilia endophytica]UGQ48033.1 TIGR04348 family glycosyltransferase [Massilia endophytica]
MYKPTICIISPATAEANNGNWHTASRWAQMLAARHSVRIAGSWAPGDEVPDLLIALHARRSAAPLAAFRAAHPDRPAILVLTGTDLYRDIHCDNSAQASLQHADALVVLQEAGLAELPPALRVKAHVIYQSAPALPPAPDAGPAIVMIGHLREEKDPLTFMRAAALAPDVPMLHIGGALDEALAAEARAAQARLPNYRWLGNVPHDEARQQLRTSRAMAICSRMEGGANVIIEAVTSGVPVLASDISGNRGMLGEDYEGYFPLGDAAALAALIGRIGADPAFLERLRGQCAARAPLFAPEAEQAALLDLVDNLIFRRGSPAIN